MTLTYGHFRTYSNRKRFPSVIFLNIRKPANGYATWIRHAEKTSGKQGLYSLLGKSSHSFHLFESIRNVYQQGFIFASFEIEIDEKSVKITPS